MADAPSRQSVVTPDSHSPTMGEMPAHKDQGREALAAASVHTSCGLRTKVNRARGKLTHRPRGGSRDAPWARP
jgi:hypothetical protein